MPCHSMLHYMVHHITIVYVVVYRFRAVLYLDVFGWLSKDSWT